MGVYMIFNSQQFMVLFAITYVLFLLFRNNVNIRNGILLVASYIFYGSWNWHFLALILLSTGVDYYVGIKIDETSPTNPNRRKHFILISIIFNLGMLGIFKYYNFFAASLFDLFMSMGIYLDPITLDVILPVGISFYTFQTLSYSIDIYREKLKPTRNLLTFATFVAFFPQLVAGPIERASNLLPQLSAPIQLTPAKIHSALFLILWGYFKKVFIADKVAQYVNVAFSTTSVNTDVPVIVAIIAFSIQIYCDFSGYTDIARGIARLMGIELMVNFRLPYFALSPSDFWNRWHISLSTWLRDYLYIPLGGNKKGQWKTYRNLMITMLLGGLWHGAAWNFVLWGGYHGLLLILYRIIGKTSKMRSVKKQLPTFSIVAQWFLMISFTLYGWLLFRAESVDQILVMTKQIFSSDIYDGTALLDVSIHALPLLIMQIAQVRSKDLLMMTKQKLWIQFTASIILLLLILIYGHHETTEFIYFQF